MERQRPKKKNLLGEKLQEALSSNQQASNERDKSELKDERRKRFAKFEKTLANDPPGTVYHEKDPLIQHVLREFKQRQTARKRKTEGSN